MVEIEILQGVIARPSEEEIHTRVWEDTIRELKPFSFQGLDLETDLTDEEKGDADNISGRLIRFFTNNADPIVTRPQFPGCGYIDMSEGDVVFGSTLFEVKTVDRMLRSVDLRQLLTYSALNSASNSYQVDSIAVFNPRRGIYAQFELDELCLEVSGKPSNVFLSEIVETVSSGEISR